MLLFEDETILRQFPVLRRAWSLRGEQAKVPISGRNAKRVLFGALNPRTGHRILMPALNMRQDAHQAFLRKLRQAYPGRQIWLLLDEASCHTAKQSLALARELNIVLLWLPKQCSELNAMDQLWLRLKNRISANHEYPNVDKHLAAAKSWINSLTRTEALRYASVLSKNFWLKSFLK